MRFGINGTRNQIGGASITEFGATLVALIGFLILPLINFSVVPLRFGLGKSIINGEVRHLAQCESFSEAIKQHQENSQKVAALQSIGGIVVNSSNLTLNVESTKFKGHVKTFSEPKSISQNWLPDDSESPCVYLLTLTVDVSISPLISCPYHQLQIPGVSGPIALTYKESCAWENLGRDPVSGDFWINQ